MSADALFLAELRYAETELPIGSRWVHVKTSRHYVVTGYTRDEGTGALRVSYRPPVADGGWKGIPWSRPLVEWIDDGKGTSTARFVRASR